MKTIQGYRTAIAIALKFLFLKDLIHDLFFVPVSFLQVERLFQHHSFPLSDLSDAVSSYVRAVLTLGLF